MSRRPRMSAVAAIAGLVLGFAGLGSASAAPTPVPVGTPPVAMITVPEAVYAGVPVTLSGADSTASSGAVSEWEWDLNGDGGFELDSTSTPWVTKTFTAGSRSVTLRVRNEGGLVATTKKTFTVRKPAAAAAAPLAPTAVTAKADGTTIDITWQHALGSPPLTYRVSMGTGNDDVVYVPAIQPNRLAFQNLVPGSYTIKVAAVNSAGAGPATESTATIHPKGEATATPAVTTSPSATASTEPTSTSASSNDSAAPTASQSIDSGSDSSRRFLGLALIGVGVALLLVAGGAALAGIRRRGED